MAGEVYSTVFYKRKIKHRKSIQRFTLLAYVAGGAGVTPIGQWRLGHRCHDEFRRCFLKRLLTCNCR